MSFLGSDVIRVSFKLANGGKHIVRKFYGHNQVLHLYAFVQTLIPIDERKPFDLIIYPITVKNMFDIDLKFSVLITKILFLLLKTKVNKYIKNEFIKHNVLFNYDNDFLLNLHP